MKITSPASSIPRIRSTTAAPIIIDIKYHHIRDVVKRGEVKLKYCETTVMLADIMTKGIHGPCHKDLAAALGIRPRSD